MQANNKAGNSSTKWNPATVTPHAHASAYMFGRPAMLMTWIPTCVRSHTPKPQWEMEPILRPPNSLEYSPTAIGGDPHDGHHSWRDMHTTQHHMGTIPTHTTHHITSTHKHDTTHTTGSCHNKYDMAPQPSVCTCRARTSRVAQARQNACLVVRDKEVSPPWIPWSTVHTPGDGKMP